MSESWKTIALGELGDTYSGLSGKTKDDFGRGKPFISYMNIYSNPRLKTDFTEFVEIGDNETQNMVSYGDIFFTTSSETPDEVGLTSVLLNEVDVVYLNSFCFGFRLQDFNTLLPEYAVYLLRGNEARKTISILAQGSTRFNLSKVTLLKKLHVTLPPLPEQQKIAEILSTVDDKIDIIDQQITSTQELKKGLMQRLLTQGIGHTEFKESKLGRIPKSWEVVKIRNIADVTAGGTPSTKMLSYWNGDIPWMNSGEINLRRIKSVEGRITELGLNKSSTKLIPENSVLIALAGQGKTRGKVAINEFPLCTNQSLATIYNFKNANYEFVFQNLESRYSEIRKMSTGDGGRGGLNLQIIKSIDIALPPIDEQKKIATIFLGYDNKLEVLLDKKELYKEQKKGLMQQLLTGKTRVVI